MRQYNRRVGAALDGTLLASPGPRRVLPRVLALVALVGWAVVLGTPLLEPAAPFARAGLNALRSGAGLLGLAGRLAAWAGLEMVRFAPLGALAVLVLGLPGASGGSRNGWRMACVAGDSAPNCAWTSAVTMLSGSSSPLAYPPGRRLSPNAA